MPPKPPSNPTRGSLALALSKAFEVMAAAAVVAALRPLGLAGEAPLWWLMALFAFCGLTALIDANRRLAGLGIAGRQLHLDSALTSICVTALVYPLGWGPMLAVGYLVVVVYGLKGHGSGGWLPAVAWSVAGIGAGQAAIGLGWVGTFTPEPEVHGVGVLGGACVALVGRLLGVQAARAEHEAAERAAAKAALERSEERFRELVQSSSDVVTVIDAERRISYVSPSAAHVMGYQPEQLLGRLSSELVHPDDAADTDDALVRLRESAGESLR